MTKPRTFGRRTHLGTALAASLATLAVLLPAGPAQATDYTQTYMQFNMCGNVCNGGGLTVAQDVERSVENRSPQPFVVTLNEVCENQYDYLWANLGPYFGYFDATGPTCRNGRRYGNAILVRTSSFTRSGPWTLPNPGGNETRHLVCLRIPMSGNLPMSACVTHIDFHSVNIAPQIKRVAELVQNEYATHGVIVGGDFNTTPSSSALNPMYRSAYAPAGNGLFNEVDTPPSLNRSYKSNSYNETTFEDGRKLDYIFVSSPDFTGYWGDATSASNSDHVVLWGGATY